MPGSRILALGLTLLSSFGSPFAYAQWRGTTGLSLGETYSDNVGRQPAGLQRDDWATDVAPWLSYAGRGARFSGSLDAKLHNWLHTDSQTAGRSDLSLSGRGLLEAIENLAFIDASISRDRQRISQFASADPNYGGTSNSTDVTHVSVSPYTRWRMGSNATGEFRLGYDQSSSGDGASFSNYTSDTASLSLQNGSAFGHLGWGFTASHINTDRKRYASTTSDKYSGSLSYAFDPEFSVRLLGGQEINDYSGESRHYWNSGAGLKWQPTDRTTLDLENTRNFFGRGFNYQFSHRQNHSAFTAHFSRNVNNSNMQTGQVTGYSLYGVSSINDYQAQLSSVMAALQASIPDDAQRYQAAVAYLASLGIFADPSVLGGTTTVEKQAYLGWVIIGVRNTVSLSATKSDRSGYTQMNALVLGDDLSTYTRTRSHGFDASWALKLSELSSVGLHYTWTAQTGYSSSNDRNSYHSDMVSLNFTSRLSPKTTATAALTESRSTGYLDYLEHSVSLMLNHTF